MLYLQHDVLVLQVVHVLGLSCQSVYCLLHLHKLLFPSFPGTAGTFQSLPYQHIISHGHLTRLCVAGQSLAPGPVLTPARSYMFHNAQTYSQHLMSPVSLLRLFVLHLLLGVSLCLYIPGMQFRIGTPAAAISLLRVCCICLIIK